MSFWLYASRVEEMQQKDMHMGKGLTIRKVDPEKKMKLIVLFCCRQNELDPCAHFINHVMLLHSREVVKEKVVWKN